jgi:hypothetical protein
VSAAFQGDLERAIPLLNENLALGRQQGDAQLTAMLLAGLGYCRVQQGDLARVSLPCRRRCRR